MNILFFADPGSIHDNKWIAYFAERGYKTYVIPRAGQMQNVGDNQITLNARLLEPIQDFSIVRIYRTLRTARKISKLVKKYRIHVIHVLYAEPNALWTLFRAWFNVPVIISSRGTDVLKTIPAAFARRTLIDFIVARAYRNAFTKADWVTATSEMQKHCIESLMGSLKNFSIIRTGVDLRLLSVPSSLPSELNELVPFILFPRYIKPLYNHEFSLRAIELLPPEIKKKYKMVFLGRDSGDLEYQQTLEALMRNMDQVRFVFLHKQSQEYLFKLYKSAALVVMNPSSDGSPVSAMEAILCNANLILGPLKYDFDIFANHAVILKDWDERELAKKITDVLADMSGKPAVQLSIRNLMDLNYNMSEMEKIYKKLVHAD